MLRFNCCGLLLLFLSFSLSAQEVTESWKELNEKGTQLFNEENYEEGLDVFVKAVAAAKKEFGVNHATYASTLQSLAVLQLYTGRLEESEKSFMQALEIHTRVVGKNNVEYESFLNGVVSLYLTMGNNAKALQYHEEYHQVAKAVHGVNSDEYLTSLMDLADRYLDNGYNDKALALLQEGKGLSANKESAYGNFCTRLFQVYAEQGDAVKAEPFFIEAKRIRNKTQEAFWKTLDFKNMTYSYQIDDQDARLVYWKEQAQQLKEADPESVDYARALMNLFLIYETQEDYTQSEKVLMEAKGIIEKNGSESDQSGLYTNLAYYYDNMGNNSLALHYYQEEMKAARNANGRDHINYGTACQNQSIYYLNHGDLKKGELLAKTGLLVLTGLNDGFTYYSAACMSLAMFADKQGDLAKTEAYQQEAVKICRMAFGEEHYIYATNALSLALTYEKQTKIAQAEALIITAKNINEKVFGKNHIQYAGYCYELARFYVRQQQYVKAAPLFHEAATIKLNRIRDNFTNLSEKEKKDLFRSGDYYFENYAYCLLKLSEKDKTVSKDLYNLIIDTKGLIYQSSAKMRTKVLTSGNKELIQLFHTWTDQRNKLAKAYSMALDERKTKGVDLTQLEAEANTTERNLARQANALNIEGFEEKKNIDWMLIKSKLQPDEAAIEIVRAARDGIREEAIYGALVITGQPQAEPDLVLLGKGLPMETKSIGYYNNAIRLKLADTLSYNTFWKPLASKLKGVKKIYFSPSGVYHQVSITSLRNPATGKFMMDEFDLRTVGNTKDLLKEKRKSNNTNSTYLIGFPDYTSVAPKFSTPKQKDSSRSLRTWKALSIKKTRYFDASSGTVAPLPGTREEIYDIEQMLKSKNIPVTAFIGKEATEGHLKKITEPSVLHIATHGFFLPNEYIPEKDNAALNKKQDPMLRSGLLLADCENTLRGVPGSAEKEDGILSAFEAMNLSLDRTNLVVLSACETGVGEIDNSEGVYGLLRAFQQAGSRYILVSLWKVDDEATQLLMTTFYELQLQGLDYSQAFNGARQAVSKKYPEPYYWGAFILIGV